VAEGLKCLRVNGQPYTPIPAMCACSVL